MGLFWQADVAQEIFRSDMIPGAVDFIPVTSKRIDYFFEQLLFFKLLRLQLNYTSYPLAGWVEFFSVGLEFSKHQDIAYRIQFFTLLALCSICALGGALLLCKLISLVALPAVSTALLGYFVILLFE